jgi:hypothetical protein
MLNLLQTASDDQTALLGCVAALLAAGAVMYLSYFVGPARRTELAQRKVARLARPQPVRRAHDQAA